MTDHSWFRGHFGEPARHAESTIDPAGTVAAVCAIGSESAADATRAIDAEHAIDGEPLDGVSMGVAHTTAAGARATLASQSFRGDPCREDVASRDETR
jgi:hypothetical protein